MTFLSKIDVIQVVQNSNCIKSLSENYGRILMKTQGTEDSFGDLFGNVKKKLKVVAQSMFVQGIPKSGTGRPYSRKGLSEVLGLTFVFRYSQLKPNIWLRRRFMNTEHNSKNYC